MTLSQVAWLFIALEILLLLAWLYSLYGPSNGTDAAGKGLGQVFLLALAGYIAIGIVVMLFQTRWGAVMVIVMASLPTLVVLIGLVKRLTYRRRF